MVMKCTKCGYTKPTKVPVKDLSLEKVLQSKIDLYESVMDYMQDDMTKANMRVNQAWKLGIIYGLLLGEVLTILAYMAGRW